MNKDKAALLYNEIDRNKMFEGTAAKEDRSLMNICFVMTPSSIRIRRRPSWHLPKREEWWELKVTVL
jgi:phosphoserine aminotransferase